MQIQKINSYTKLPQLSYKKRNPKSFSNNKVQKEDDTLFKIITISGILMTAGIIFALFSKKDYFEINNNHPKNFINQIKNLISQLLNFFK